jgi:hypothetical protein
VYPFLRGQWTDVVVVSIDYGWARTKTITRHILHYDLSRLLPGTDSGEGKTHSQVRLAALRVRAKKITFSSVEAPARQGAKAFRNTTGSSTGISRYVKLSQRSQAGCIGA